MTDPDIIRKKYASMHDEQLKRLAREDSHQLTDQALVLLKEEFVKRKLVIDVFSETKKEESAKDEEREMMPGFSNPGSNADDMMMGRSYVQAQSPVEQKGETDNDKKILINLSGEEIHRLIKRCNRSMLIYGLIFLAGFSVSIASFLGSIADGRFIVAWGAIVIGGFGFFHAYAGKVKCLGVLKVKENSPNLKE